MIIIVKGKKYIHVHCMLDEEQFTYINYLLHNENLSFLSVLFYLSPFIILYFSVATMNL